MSKRKFGLKSLFATRSNNDTKPLSPSQLAEGGGEQWPSDDSDGEDHFDPNDINRPPPLDAKTESQLRHACRIIVDNLKPSGHDIEDTRMMNDMYVDGVSDDEAPSATYMPGKKQATASAGPSTWFEESSDRNSKVPHAHELQATADKRRTGITLAERESYHAKRRGEHQRLSKILKVQNDEESVVLSQVESPIAPAASVRRLSTIDHITSPIPHVPALPRAPVGPRNASSSTTTSTQPTASTNGVTSVSTSATSAYPTPASTSKRTSDTTKRDMQEPQSIAAAAGAWMKEEVDRRRQAEPTTRDQTTDSSSPIKEDPQHLRQTYNQSQATSAIASPPSSDPLVDNAVKQTPVSQAQVHSRRESATSRRKSSSGPSFTVDGKCSVGTRSPQAIRKTPSHEERSVPTSEKPSTSELVDPPPALPVQVEPLPPSSAVDASMSPRAESFDKTMAEIRARMAVTGLSSQIIGCSGPPLLAVNPHDVPPLRSATNPMLFGNSSRDSRLSAVPDRMSSYSDHVPRLPPVPNKHQLDNSIIVKDFGRPTSARARRNQPVSKIQPQTDIDAIGFDSFMNVVEKANTNNAPSSPTSSSHYGSPTLSTAPTRPGTGLHETSAWSLDEIDSMRPPSGRSQSALSAITSAATGSAGIEALTLPASPPLVPPSSSYDQLPPSGGPLPASSDRRYSSHSTNSEDPQTPTEPIPKLLSPRNMSAFDFLKDTPVPPGHSSSRKDENKSDFFRVEPHPTYNSANGIANQSNGVAGNPDNVSSPSSAAATNGHASPPAAPKSAQTFSLTSHSSNRTTDNSCAQTNGYAPGYPFQTLSYASTASKPGLKNWLSRRRSRSLIPGSAGLQKPGRGAGFSCYDEADEDDDPLICAAPVVAFGRGY